MNTISNDDDVLIVGGGIGGLVLALELHDAGIPCRIYEAAPQLRPLGVGINILPHAARVLGRLGLEDALTRVAVLTRESVFFNRFGQLIYTEPAGRFAGYADPQYSIHRGELHLVLADAVRERIGDDALVLGHECTRIEQDENGVDVHFRLAGDGSGPARAARTTQTVRRARVVVGCDGVHSALRRQFHPGEREPHYTGINMWRGVAVWDPILSGASMIRMGWFKHGKIVIYPIRDDVDGPGANPGTPPGSGAGKQLVNWVVEIETSRHESRDWGRDGRIEDFIDTFRDWRFDWLDVPTLLRASQSVLEYPMVDQDPLDRWTFGRATLLGDAAHPMVPRGSNGAGQAILDAQALRHALVRHADPADALRAYEDDRRDATARVVLANRTNPPDAIIREVWERTADQPFERIDDVISTAELVAISERYKHISETSTKLANQEVHP